MIICGERRNLQKDKHPPIWDYISVAKLNPLLSEDTWNTLWETRFSGLMKHRVWREPALLITCRVHPKVKCAGSSSCCGTERLVRVEEKLNAPKYWDYNETQSRAFRTSDWAEGSPSNMTWPKAHSKSGLYTTLWIVFEKPATAWAWTPSNISGETWKCASAPISRRGEEGEEKNGR